MEAKYKKVENFLREQIQKGIYKVGDLLPSENELCAEFSITRTTARKALDELLKNGFIEKRQGKGSVVRERRQSLGLLNVKGFSEVVGQDVKTIFLSKPAFRIWGKEIRIPVSKKEIKSECIHFERLRCVGEVPVMLENNWFAGDKLEGFADCDFVEGSFFKTLSRNYHIEITGSESELRAEDATKKIAELLQISTGAPVLHISLKFLTSHPDICIYSELYCNTEKYPVGNVYQI